MRAEKRGVNIDGMALMKLRQELENFQLALPIEAVAALGFDGGGAVSYEFVEVRDCAGFEPVSGGAAQFFDGRADTAAFARDFFVAGSGDALFVFLGAAGG